ncbi:MAG: chromophore lyase CpcT/CpeT [Melioribacteraceae bacterium]|nr:chromophore lyase CpcT/CpeT [Melioribacteraceae bacterium]
MKYLVNALWLSLHLFALIGCNSNDKSDLRLIKKWMTGSFSSEEQSKLDTNYFNIHLHMVPIWEKFEKSEWLYVEQAASWALDKPYRQRVYRLTALEGNKFESAVFTIPNPLRFAGEWKSDKPLDKLTPDSLSQKIGCSIILVKEGDAFIGSTIDKSCPSELRGASYATSEVRIEENLLKSWDRGFNENDLQVWGAELGPYIFKKTKIPK